LIIGRRKRLSPTPPTVVFAPMEVKTGAGHIVVLDGKAPPLPLSPLPGFKK